MNDYKESNAAIQDTRNDFYIDNLKNCIPALQACTAR